MPTAAQCQTCPFRNRDKPITFVGDPATCKYVLVGEAPGYFEARSGKPFVGETGDLLEAFTKRAGMDLRGPDFFLTNALDCRVLDKNKVKQAVQHCRPRLLEELAQVNPEATIVLMGNTARMALYPDEKGGILTARGWRKWEGHDVFIMAHPSYYLYNPDQAPMLIKDINRIKRGKLPPTGPFEILPMPDHRVEEEVQIPHLGFTAYRIDTQAQMESLLMSLHNVPKEQRDLISFDLETDQIDFQRDRVLCATISTALGLAFVITDKYLYEEGFEFVTTNWSKAQQKAFHHNLKYKRATYLHPRLSATFSLMEMFAIPGYRWAGHNSKFDLRFLIGQLGVKNARVDFDTIIAHYCLDERSGGHGLKPLSDDYYDVGDYEGELDIYLGKGSDQYSRIPRSVLYNYNAMDTECTLRLAHDLERELYEEGLFDRPFMSVMMKAVPMLLNAELAGVEIDWEENYRMDEEEFDPEIERLAELLRGLCGQPGLNPGSSQQIIKILFDQFKFPIVDARTRAGGHHVTGRTSQSAILDAWEKMHERGELDVSDEAWEFEQLLVKYRHLRKLQGSYIRKWRRYKGIDNRVHTTYMIRGTVTGRLSATDPPMQTIPSKVTDRWGPMVANMHISKEGWSLMYADYSQAELMVLAGMSNDPFMIKTFQKDGADYHSEVARAAFGDDFTRDQRQACKKLTFGWAYGGNAKEIALDALQFDGPVAERFAHEWDRMFPGVTAWREVQAEHMITKGYVESMFGRRRRQVLLTGTNIGKAKRIAVNAPIQSTVSDLTLLSAVSLYERYKNSGYARVIMLIHDSVILEVRDDKLDEVKEVMHRTLLEIPKQVLPNIPFQADVKISKQLGDLT